MKIEITDIQYCTIKEAVREYWHSTSKQIIKKGRDKISPFAYNLHMAIMDINENDLRRSE